MKFFYIMRQHIAFELKCVECKGLFTATKKSAKFCSRRCCSRNWYRTKDGAKYARERRRAS